MLRKLLQSNIWTLAGCLFLVAACFSFASKYERSWRFGRYFMPVSVLQDDGIHYATGVTADPLTQMLAHYDCEPEFHLVALVLIAAGMGYAVHLQRDTEKKRKWLQRHYAELGELYRRRREKRPANSN